MNFDKHATKVIVFYAPNKSNPNHQLPEIPIKVGKKKEKNKQGNGIIRDKGGNTPSP